MENKDERCRVTLEECPGTVSSPCGEAGVQMGSGSFMRLFLRALVFFFFFFQIELGKRDSGYLLRDKGKTDL